MRTGKIGKRPRRNGTGRKRGEDGWSLKRPAKKTKGGTPPRLTRKGAAEEAGLSEDQQKTALRVAKIPENEFNFLFYNF
jgi:hypothetical protein